VTCWPSGTSASELWRQIWSTNPQERLHKEIRRRTDVVGIFPDRAAIIRLIASLLIGETEEWADERRSMSLEALSKVRPVRFPDARHGTEDALPASLTAKDRGRITQWSIHHFSGRDLHPWRTGCPWCSIPLRTTYPRVRTHLGS
jgi:hypothetical protein